MPGQPGQRPGDNPRRPVRDRATVPPPRRRRGDGGCLPSTWGFTLARPNGRVGPLGRLRGVRVVPANHWQGEGPWPPRGSNTGTGCRQSDRNALCAGPERRVSEKVVRSTQRDAPQSSFPPAVKPIWRPRSRDPSPSRSAHRIAPEPRKPPGATVGAGTPLVTARLVHTLAADSEHFGNLGEPKASGFPRPLDP